MKKLIGIILGILIVAGLYIIAATITEFHPYNFSEITSVGKTVIIIWHLIGAYIGYRAAGEDEL